MDLNSNVLIEGEGWRTGKLLPSWYSAKMPGLTSWPSWLLIDSLLLRKTCSLTGKTSLSLHIFHFEKKRQKPFISPTFLAFINSSLCNKKDGNVGFVGSHILWHSRCFRKMDGLLSQCFPASDFSVFLSQAGFASPTPSFQTNLFLLFSTSHY